MSAVKEVAVELTGARDLALIGNDDSIWLVVPLRWWDLSTLLYWLFLPSDKRAFINLRMYNGEQVRVRAARVAKRYVRLTGTYK